MTWNPENVEKLRKALLRGSYGKAADVFGVTRSAIAGAVRRHINKRGMR